MEVEAGILNEEPGVGEVTGDDATTALVEITPAATPYVRTRSSRRALGCIRSKTSWKASSRCESMVSEAEIRCDFLYSLRDEVRFRPPIRHLSL